MRQTEATKQLTLVATIFLLYGVGSFAASLAALLLWFKRSGHLGRD